MAKYKECEPSQTINKIFNILKEMDVQVNIIEMNSNEQVYSCNVAGVYKGKYIGKSNGKGKTKEFALASGLAEFMEHLSNDFLIAPNSTYIKDEVINKSKKKYGFYVHSDEILMTLKECYNQTIFRELYKLYGNTMFLPFFNEDKNLDENKISCLPFKNLFTNEINYLPKHKFGTTFFFGTNGMGAGNSFREAILHGISEIFERKSTMNIILEDDKKCPNIPLSFLNRYPEYVEIIEYLQENNFHVQLKDFSCGGIYPTLCLVLTDLKNGRVIICPGSDPVFHIALERCFTEIFQNKGINDFNYFLKDNFCFESTNTELLRDYRGVMPGNIICYPDKIVFENNEEYHLEQFIFDDNEEKTIEDTYEHVMNILKKNNINCWYHDSSYYGFPCYQVIFSNIENLYINWSSKSLLDVTNCEFDNITNKLSRLFYYNTYEIDALYKLGIEFMQKNYQNYLMFEHFLTYNQPNELNIIYNLLYFVLFIKEDYKNCLLMKEQFYNYNLDNGTINDYFVATNIIAIEKLNGNTNIEEICNRVSLLSNISFEEAQKICETPIVLCEKVLNIKNYLIDMEEDYEKYILHIHEKELSMKSF